jgi:hypothetical protein
VGNAREAQCLSRAFPFSGYRSVPGWESGLAANPPSASNTIGTQVARWGFEGDSLLITKLWGTEIAKRFGRQP